MKVEVFIMSASNIIFQGQDFFSKKEGLGGDIGSSYFMRKEKREFRMLKGRLFKLFKTRGVILTFRYLHFRYFSFVIHFWTPGSIAEIQLCPFACLPVTLFFQDILIT